MNVINIKDENDQLDTVKQDDNLAKLINEGIMTSPEKSAANHRNLFRSMNR